MSDDTFDLDDLLDGVDVDEIGDGIEDESMGESNAASSGIPSVTTGKAARSGTLDQTMDRATSTPVYFPGASLDHKIDCHCEVCARDYESVSFDNPSRPMTKREALLHAFAFPAKPGETVDEISARVGMPRRTIYRYYSNESFKAELAEIANHYLGEHRRRVAEALIEGACEPGKGQASMQRIYWQKLGELVDARSLQVEEADEILSRILGIPKDRLPP